MSTRPDNADGPEDIDAAFAEIVAGLEQDSTFATWVEQESETNSPAVAEQDTENGPVPPQPPRDWMPPDEEDEGHFVPPEPPPLPTPRPSTLGGFAVIGAGLLLLLVPGLVGMGSSGALAIGLVAISAGMTWLLFRLRRTPPSEDDDGAQV